MFEAVSHTWWSVIAKRCLLSSSQLPDCWGGWAGVGVGGVCVVGEGKKGFKANSKMQDTVEVSRVGSK